MKLSLIVFLQSAKEVLKDSSFKLTEVTIFGKSEIRVDKWQTLKKKSHTASNH